jgi:hypothetical protein
MADGMDVTIVGLDALLVDLAKAQVIVVAEGPKVVSKGALNVKRDWVQAWSGHPHIRGLARAVSYDTTVRKAEFEAEIGPDKDKPQGPLGNLIEFGDAEGGAPIPAGLPALQAEEPRFVAAVEALAAQALP